MRKRLLIFLLIVTILFTLITIFTQRISKSGKWNPIQLSDIQFKAGKVKMSSYSGKTGITTVRVDDYYSVYAQVPRKLLRDGDVTNFHVRLKGNITASLSISYDDKTGIIFAHPHRVDTEGYIYIGKSKIVGDILEPVFLEGITFNFSPRAECGEFYCAGIEIVLPYTFGELKRMFEQESKGAI